MSNIFNLSNIFTESSFPTALKNVTSGEVYRLSVLRDLNALNESFNNATAKLYKAINEAETKEAENDIFKEYFAEIEKAFGITIQQINEMQSRFIINIDNIVDANMDILNNTSLLSECKPFHFTFRKYKNINKPEFPRINPISIYRKEFDFIGQLLQDLGPAASNSSKLQVIATVYNNLNKGNSIDLTKKCIADILGEDEDDDDCDISEFPKALYDCFQEDEAEDKVIDKALLYNIKLSMQNYKSVVAAVVSTGDTLIKQLMEIKEDLKSFMTNGEKNSYTVNTPTDGIRNTSYKLDTYTMNQLDLFMKTKINQVMQMANVYSIALSVKLDATTQYYNQCKEILRMADMQCAGVPASSEDNIIDTDTNMGEDYGTGEGKDPEEPETEPVEPDSDPEDPDDGGAGEGDDGNSSENPDTSSNGDASGEPEANPNGSDEPFEMEPGPDMKDLDEELAKFEEQCILYEYQLFALNNQYQRLQMIEEVQQYVIEFDAGKIDGAVKGPSVIGKAMKAVGEKVKQIVEKLSALANNFYDKVLTPSNLKIKRLQEQKQFIDKPIDHKRDDGGNIMPIIRPQYLQKFSIPKLPDKGTPEFEKLTSDEEYYEYAFPEADKVTSRLSAVAGIKVEGKEKFEIKEGIIGTIITPLQVDGIKNTNKVEPQDLFKWCIGYPALVEKLKQDLQTVKSMSDKIAKDEKAAQATSQSESTRSLAKLYFTEEENDSAKANDQSQGGGSDSAESKPTASYEVYFRVCSAVMQGRIVAAQRVFNEYSAYLLWHINYRRTEKGLPIISWYAGEEPKNADQNNGGNQ